jgi:hypothetical protein
MMPYQTYQLFEAERTKTQAEIRRTDEQRGEASRALSLAWHRATRPKAKLRALLGAVAGARLPQGEFLAVGSGSGPKIRRSCSSIATSLMLASRRLMSPSPSNSHSSLP